MIAYKYFTYYSFDMTDIQIDYSKLFVAICPREPTSYLQCYSEITLVRTAIKC